LSTTIIFLNNLDRQLLHVGNIEIDLCYNSDQPSLFLDVFNSGEFMFGDNAIRADPVRGRLLVWLEAISATQLPPTNDINTWTLFLPWGSKLPVDGITD